MNENHLRSIVKGASWRLIGTLDTILLSLLYTGQAGKAFQIGGIELFTKIFLFYLHERIWMKLPFGISVIIKDGKAHYLDKHYRSFLKGLSWRVIGSLDTFWIALFVTRNSEHALQTAFYISATEVTTKVLLFWLHERIWFKIKWGIKVPALSMETPS